MIRTSFGSAARGSSRTRLLALFGAAVLIVFSGSVARAEDRPSSEEQSSGVVQSAKGAGRAIGLAFHDIGQGARRIGLEIGRGAAQVGREIGQGAARVGREVGEAAREGGRALSRAIRGGDSSSAEGADGAD